MNTARAIFVLLLCAVLAGCTRPVFVQDWFVNERAGATPTPQRFVQCHGHGCSQLSVTGLTQQEWRYVVSLFVTRPLQAAKTEAKRSTRKGRHVKKSVTSDHVLAANTLSSAESERAAVAVAVGYVREVIGKKTGTEKDQPGTDYRSHEEWDMDCVDETVNTVTTLRLLAQAKLLRYHTLAPPTLRGFQTIQTLHHTAVLQDETTDIFYAVDPWEKEQGDPALVMPVKQWQQD